jgi:hypothetical protein
MSEQRTAAELVRHPRVDADAGRAVGAGEGHVEILRALADVEGGTVVLAGEQAAAGDDVDDGIAVPARDIHPGLAFTRLIPLDGEPMRGVLAAQAEPAGDPGRADPGEADQADAGHRPAGHELRPERGRQQPRGDVGVNPVVHQETSLHQARHPRQAHALLPSARLRSLRLRAHASRCSAREQMVRPPARWSRVRPPASSASYEEFSTIAKYERTRSGGMAPGPGAGRGGRRSSRWRRCGSSPGR